VRVTDRNGVRYCALSLRLEADAVSILRAHAPGPKAYGRLVARLLYQLQAVEDERRRVQQIEITGSEE
jgi:hypothetical protein